MPQLFRSSLKCFGIIICTTLFVHSYSSCTKSSPIYIVDDTITTPPGDTTTTPPKDTTTIPPKDTTVKGRSFSVGTGARSLTIDGSNFVVNGVKYNLQNADTIKIKSGSYDNITIRNISVPLSGKRLMIVNEGGLVVLNGTKQMNIANLNNVTISGSGTAADGRGFVFQDNTYRAVVLSGTINNFTLQNMFFKNIRDYVITYPGLDKVQYNGSADSYASNIAFLNLDAENVAPLIQLDGDITSSGFRGLIKGLEIAHVTCINSDPGAAIYVGNAENFSIHDNYMNNINKNNNNHNGVFFTRGYGKFYGNIITNHEGNALRAWTYSIDKTGTIEIYNNIVYNSRMYSGFEIQVPPYIKALSTFKPANAKVYNNTVGRMNTERMSFPGRLLDLYNIYGTLELYNNLVFFNNDAIILNNMSDTKIIRNENNIYFAKETEAVVNTISFTSKIPGLGATAK